MPENTVPDTPGADNTGVGRRPRVLMTLADVAWPVDAGKRLRAASMIRAVAAGCDVDVVVLFADADPTVVPTPPDVTATWLVVPPMLVNPVRAGIAVLRRLLPWQIAVQNWPVVRRQLSARGLDYDLVWFGALDHFAQLRDTVRASHMVVDCDDVETEKLKRFLALPRNAALPWADRVQRRVELPLWGRIQKAAVRTGDAVLVCSDLDRERLIAQATPGDAAGASRIVSIPNTYPVPTDRFPRDPQGVCTLVVIANYGTDQNVDAATFVATEVLPELRRVVPQARLRLVGRRADRLTGLAGIDGLDIVGPVDSVARELANAHAVLVPIRFGGGTRLKVVEAMAYGVPIVSTTAGAEGINVVDGEQLLLGDTPAAMAAAVVRLLAEPDLAPRLSAGGRALYEAEYRPEATAVAVQSLLADLLNP